MISQSSESSVSLSSGCGIEFPICNPIPMLKKATVIGSSGCAPNGIYNNILLNCTTGIWKSPDESSTITLTRDSLTGNWNVHLTTKYSYIYTVELPPSTLSCERGWITGVAQANLVDTEQSSSSSSSSDSSMSSTSDSSSDSSTLRNLYREYFSNCDGPECTSEYYCYYDVIEEWRCSSEYHSYSYAIESESSDSTSSSSSSKSSSSSSSNSSETPTCSPTVIIIFG